MNVGTFYVNLKNISNLIIKNMRKIYFILILSCSMNNAQCFTQVVASEIHSAAVRENGTIVSWGAEGNSWGILGQGNVGYIYTPTQAGTQNDWTSLFTGSYTAFGIKTNGTLWGTGGNEEGNLGIGTHGSGNVSKVFVQVGTSNNWKSGSGSREHVVAVKNDGTIWSWGSNNYRELGNNTTVSHYTPQQIGTGTDWNSVQALLHASIGLKTNGTLWGWGSNGSGAIGQSIGISGSGVPLQIGTDNNWSAIATGGASLHTLALKNDGRLYVFGGAWSSGVGALGLGPVITFISTPTQIGTDSNWSKISAHFNTSFAIKANGTLWGWGQNNYGQLGDGTNVDKSYPVQIGSDTDWASVSAGHFHTIGKKTNGDTYVWGMNTYGQLGLANTNNVNVPTLLNTCVILGTEELQTQQSSLSPNPARQFFQVKTGVNSTFDTVFIHDSSGRLIKTENFPSVSKATIQIEEFAPGLYTVILKSSLSTIATYKLIKE